MKHLLILFFSLFYLLSCTSETSNSDSSGTTVNSEANTNQGVTGNSSSDTGNTDSTDFEAAFNNFFQALQTGDTAAINTFIHPDFGLWVIEQPGAVPKMTFVTDITDFKREYQNRSFFTIAEEMKACDLQEEAFPTFSCADVDYEAGKSGYSKEGCFVWKPEKFQKSGYWNYASLPMQDIKRIQTTLPRVQKSVLHTNTSFEFHFGYIQGHWRLLFAKLIYPCSA
ncbi:hypothetical protein ACSX1A_14260 [Pontibacter sp. MBLB2868]|uniref:hypothetical protein n=1 Tax=Pontibacter sp. MBLB2868 TaxID=3451555 RepID=UPI003F757084